MTFNGSIPTPVRAIIAQTVKTWPTGDVYVACSGNFTIERVIRGIDPGCQIHSNDVSLYSTALGRFLTGQTFDLAVAAEHEADAGWLTPFLDGGAGTVAALMLATRFAADIGDPHPWRVRNVEGHIRQFEKIHDATVARLEESRFVLASYACEDARSWLGRIVPDDATVLAYPPTTRGEYEKQYAPLDRLFTWKRPEYEPLDDDGLDDVVRRITDRPRYLLVSALERDDLAGELVSYVQVDASSRPLHVYARAATTHRYVVPNILPEPVKIPRLTAGDEIGDHLTLKPLSPGQFHALRSKYLNAGIRTTLGNLKCPTAVLVDGKIIGVICFGLWADPDTIMLTTDFAVQPHDYPKLSKLVVMAALSHEAARIVTHSFTRRCRRLQTAVYTNAPVSMKYRGLMDLVDRADLDAGGTFKHKLTYRGDTARWSLDDALVEWKSRWGQRVTAPTT